MNLEIKVCGQSDVDEAIPEGGAEVGNGKSGQVDRDRGGLEGLHFVHGLHSEEREGVSTTAANQNDDGGGQGEVVVEEVVHVNIRLPVIVRAGIFRVGDVRVVIGSRGDREHDEQSEN